MLDMLEKEINKLNLFNGNMLEIIFAVADSIPTQTIPYRAKLAIAISEIVLFSSQFKINIKHWNKSIIPVNSITFCIAKSGASKDSSLKAARKCFTKGYELINEHRQKNAIAKAIRIAEKNGDEDPHKYSTYKDYLTTPNPLFVAISTLEGFIQHLNDLSEDKLGAGYIQSGEFGAELASNANLIENIKLLAELYDEGSKEVKIIKARENQSKEVKNLPVSALFMGSQDNLLFDETIKHKFKTEFTTKLARRSFFIFVNEEIPLNQYSSIEELLKLERSIENVAIETCQEVSEYIAEITPHLIKRAGSTLKVSDEVRDLFSLYKRYNEEIANTMNSQMPISKLTRAHLQWKALKLAGAFAIIQNCNEIDIDHYKAAVEFVELINNDINSFEKELVKEPYELFANYVRLYANNGEYSIGLHNLRKLGFIPMKTSSDIYLKELVKLVSSYDKHGVYELKKDTIYFKEIKKVDKMLISYLPCSGTKQQRVTKCKEGFVCEEIVFSDLKEMLEGDFAYTPFRFVNGIRGKDNIDSTCKWIVLDIDSSEITDEEAHLLLSDINHFIARTSNPDNPNKFRLLIELDAEVDVPDYKWKLFIETIIEDLGITADVLAKSQIYFSYSGREILSTLDAEPLAVKPYLDVIANYNPTDKKPLSIKTCNAMLNDPFTTFDKAFNAKDGEGRRKLIWAVRYARELGCTKEYALNLIRQITDYWVKGFPEYDLNVMLNQISRWTFTEEINDVD